VKFCKLIRFNLYKEVETVTLAVVDVIGEGEVREVAAKFADVALESNVAGIDFRKEVSLVEMAVFQKNIVHEKHGLSFICSH